MIYTVYVFRVIRYSFQKYNILNKIFKLSSCNLFIKFITEKISRRYIHIFFFHLEAKTPSYFYLH